jgi:hypothetical protein
MGALLVLSFVVVIAPLAYFLGVDSRLPNDRGWLGGRR